MSFRGDRLRDLREQRKIATGRREGSQGWTAKRIGAHVTSLSDWERGENEPSGRHVASLATLFGVEAAFFYGAEGAAEEDEEAASMEPFARDLAAVLHRQAERAAEKQVAPLVARIAELEEALRS